MAWTAPITWTLQQTVTSAQLNAQLRSNMLETAPAKATAAGRLIVTSGVNRIAERVVATDINNDIGTRTSTSYGTLTSGGAGPSVTVTTGPLALTFMNARSENSDGGVATWTSFAISGATTDPIIDQRAILQQAGTGDANRVGVISLNNINDGSNTFLMQYRVSGGTGTFQDRRLIVMAL